MVKFVIPLSPTTKKNSSIVTLKNRKRPIILPSKSFADYQKAAGVYLDALEIDQPVNVKALFYRKTRHRVDLTNLNEALHDVLVHYHVLKDDNCKIIVSTDGSRVLYDKENPRTEVYISEIPNYSDPFEKG